jgi:hypothetical protein
MFKRDMRRVHCLCDEEADYYDCDGCTWEGIGVSKGDSEVSRCCVRAARLQAVYPRLAEMPKLRP